MKKGEKKKILLGMRMKKHRDSADNLPIPFHLNLNNKSAKVTSIKKKNWLQELEKNEKFLSCDTPLHKT